MSTKIYDAYRLPARPVTRLHAEFAAFRGEASQLARTLFARQVVKQAVNAHDTILFGARRTDEAPLTLALREFRRQWKETKKTGQRHPDSDIELTIVWLPFGRFILVKTFTEQSEYLKLFERMFPDHQDYSYWNNTDPPDDVSTRAWNKRGRDWDTAFPSGTFRDGYQFDLIGPYLPYWNVDKSDVALHCPAPEVRARAVAEELTVNALCSLRDDELDPMRRVIEVLHSDEYAVESARRATEILPMMPALTLDILAAPVHRKG